MAKNVKIKILKPVVHAGAVHRPNKVGRITEVPADQAKVLIRGGFAEEAADDALLDVLDVDAALGHVRGELRDDPLLILPQHANDSQNRHGVLLVGGKPQCTTERRRGPCGGIRILDRGIP